MDFSLKSPLAQASRSSLCTLWHRVCKINPRILLGIHHNLKCIEGVRVWPFTGCLVACTCHVLNIALPSNSFPARKGLPELFLVKGHLTDLRKRRNTSRDHLPLCCHHDVPLQTKEQVLKFYFNLYHQI